MGESVERLSFLDQEQVSSVRQEYGTPVYTYDQATLEAQARQALACPHAFGLTVRYAMKACPSAAVIRVLHRMGLKIDASSGHEARRAMRAGVPAESIMLTAQELAADFPELVEAGVRFNACSLHQLNTFGQRFPGRDVAIRVNPGLGSGHSNRTNVGGPSASFGIWHEHLREVETLRQQHDMRITVLHSHIGSGSDPAVWQRCARLSLEIASRLPEVKTVNLGGGHKVGRMASETSTDMQIACATIADEFRSFHQQHGRQLHLEIEPGTYFVAAAGSLVCSVIDVVDTGADGYSFLKLDSGMTEILRPSMYGAQHPVVVVPADATSRGVREYIVVGHCCESGDLLTPAPDNPEALQPRSLTEARIGDAVVVGGCGAYCAAMSASNYNSFPEAPEVLLATDGGLHLVRRRQSLDQILTNELIPEFLQA